LIDREVYYKDIISRFEDEDKLVAFLNTPEILTKFSDEDREYLVTTWLADNGWLEVKE